MSDSVAKTEEARPVQEMGDDDGAGLYLDDSYGDDSSAQMKITTIVA